MRPLRLALCLAAFAAFPAAAEAQRVLGPTLDATTLRRGMLRTMLQAENTLLNGRWNDGLAESLGAGLSVNLGGALIGSLSEVDAYLAGLNRADAVSSLGRSRVDLRQRFAVTRLGLEYGITDRISVFAQAPFVRVRAESQLRLDASEASAGLNPLRQGSGVAAANRAVVDAYTNAVQSLTQRRDDCVANAGSHPECASILSEATQVDLAILRGSQLAAAFVGIYGAQGLGDGERYVPLETSIPHVALMGIGIFLQQDFERWGVTDVTDLTGFPAGASAPITASELEALIAASDSGVGARIPARSSRQDLGDVDFGITLKLFDAFEGDSARLAAGRFGIRQSLRLTYRLGGGNFDLPDDLIDLGTGSGHDAIALHSNTDFIFNEKWWATVGLGFVRGATHERDVRLPLLAGVDLIGLDRQTRVRIQPANVIELRVAPRWSLNDYFGIGGEWRLRTRGRDKVTDLAAAPISPALAGELPFGDGAINAPSNSNEQRWAWTIAYSTLASNARGKAGLPLEIGYTHEQSISSSKGIVPRRWEDRLQIRYYTRLFGR